MQGPDQFVQGRDRDVELFSKSTLLIAPGFQYVYLHLTSYLPHSYFALEIDLKKG